MKTGRIFLAAGALAAAVAGLFAGPGQAGDVATERGGRAGRAAAAVGCPLPGDAAMLERGMLDEVNARRRAQGLRPLRPDPALRRAAAVIACDNARRGRMDHVALREGDMPTRVRAEGYRFRMAAEALAHGYRAPDRLAQAWYVSEYHYPTLMTPDVREAGIAVVLSPSGAPWWAMISAQPR